MIEHMYQFHDVFGSKLYNFDRGWFLAICSCGWQTIRDTQNQAYIAPAMHAEDLKVTWDSPEYLDDNMRWVR